MDLTNLTPEQRANLLAQLKEEDKKEQEKIRQDREAYKKLRSEAVEEMFPHLLHMSNEMEHLKKRVYDRFSTLLEMKKMVFKPTDRQQIGGGSHTFTTADGSKSIIIGMNVTDDWDETVKDGLDRVNDWITSLIEDSDGKTRTLVGMIRDLLKPTSGGKLKASRIMDLSNKAEELGDEKLIDAVKIIEQSYSPRNSSMYIVAQYRDDKGREVRIPLSMSAV